MTHFGEQTMNDLGQLKFMVAAPDSSGRDVFTDIDTVARHVDPGIIETIFFWGFPNTPQLPGDIGGVPADIGFAEKGESKIGLICFPPHSAGKLDLAATMGEGSLVVHDEDPAMHKSDTVDIEIVISGKVDIELESGETRTLVPGSCLIMGGVMHAWKNHYDEACIFAIVVTGAGT
jgi:hypothetical protein